MFLTRFEAEIKAHVGFGGFLAKVLRPRSQGTNVRCPDRDRRGPPCTGASPAQAVHGPIMRPAAILPLRLDQVMAPEQEPHAAVAFLSRPPFSVRGPGIPRSSTGLSDGPTLPKGTESTYTTMSGGTKTLWLRQTPFVVTFINPRSSGAAGQQGSALGRSPPPKARPSALSSCSVTENAEMFLRRYETIVFIRMCETRFFYSLSDPPPNDRPSATPEEHARHVDSR